MSASNPIGRGGCGTSARAKTVGFGPETRQVHALGGGLVDQPQELVLVVVNQLQQLRVCLAKLLRATATRPLIKTHSQVEVEQTQMQPDRPRNFPSVIGGKGSRRFGQASEYVKWRKSQQTTRASGRSRGKRGGATSDSCSASGEERRRFGPFLQLGLDTDTVELTVQTLLSQYYRMRVQSSHPLLTDARGSHTSVSCATTCNMGCKICGCACTMPRSAWNCWLLRRKLRGPSAAAPPAPPAGCGANIFRGCVLGEARGPPCPAAAAAGVGMPTTGAPACAMPHRTEFSGQACNI
eukprot:1194272-Prorocentrum_minimum.AAC.5